MKTHLGTLISLPRRRGVFTCLLAIASAFAIPVGAAPIVTNVVAVQQALPSQMVNITYTISDSTSTNVNIKILVSKDSGATWTVPASTFTGAYGNIAVTPTPTSQTVVWNAGLDWGGHFNTTCRVRVQASDSDLQVIPPTSVTSAYNVFEMGDSVVGGYGDESPHPVTISSAFNMEANLISGGEWNIVVEGFAVTNGYDLAAAQQNAASGPSFKLSNHPVQQVKWYDAVKFCNARSQYEGATPVYYLDAGYTTVYKTGTVDNLYINPAANGYRLPTEAQWEYAARGGAPVQNFPWTVNNSINLSQANYTEVVYYPGGGANYTYDYWYDSVTVPPGWPTSESSSTYVFYNPYTATPQTSPYPSIPAFTSPIGSYSTNGFGLFDMAGNVREWCWDWYGYSYYSPYQTDPQGPSSGSARVLRGGSWYDDASHERCANRDSASPSTATSYIGFRCVRGLFQ